MLQHHDDVYAEFPDCKDKIDRLLRESRRFAQLIDDYARVDQNVFGLESKGAPVGGHVIEDLKKQRLHLKDRIQASLR